MSDDATNVVTCPPDFVDRALALVLRHLPPEQRYSVTSAARGTDLAGLFVVIRSGELAGACWGHPQPGNTAIFWSPQVRSGVDLSMLTALVKSTTNWLDERGVGMAQALFPDRNVPVARVLVQHRFVFVSDLAYLCCTTSVSRDVHEAGNRLSYETYDPSQRRRLMRLVEQTYVGSLDCPSLDGQRNMDDVLEGYAATGVWDPRLWFFVQRDGKDVGVLLHSTYPDIGQREVTYMGIIPEVRGQRIGLAIVHHAQRLACESGVNGLVLAVDVTNEPAVNMYEHAGFHQWDRRAIFVRITKGRGKATQGQEPYAA